MQFEGVLALALSIELTEIKAELFRKHTVHDNKQL